MIIVISGLPGAGKSSLAKRLAKELNFNFISIGGLRKELAKHMGLSLLELDELSLIEKEYDTFFDNFIKKFCKEEKNVVIDSRIAWLFCKNSVKVFVTASLEEIAKRIKKRDFKVLGDIDYIKYAQDRIKEERRRLKKRYGVNIYDFTNYDILFDTTNMSLKEEVHYLLQILKLNK